MLTALPALPTTTCHTLPCSTRRWTSAPGTTRTHAPRRFRTPLAGCDGDGTTRTYTAPHALRPTPTTRTCDYRQNAGRTSALALILVADGHVATRYRASDALRAYAARRRAHTTVCSYTLRPLLCSELLATSASRNRTGAGGNTAGTCLGLTCRALRAPRHRHGRRAAGASAPRTGNHLRGTAAERSTLRMAQAVRGHLPYNILNDACNTTRFGPVSIAYTPPYASARFVTCIFGTRGRLRKH